MRLILGSNSARRKEILSYFKVPFLTAVSHFDELSVPFLGDPAAYCTTLALKKAEALADNFKEDLILTADTVVYFNQQVFNKPSSRNEAFEMLAKFSGNSHEVYTGVCAYHKGKHKLSFDRTEVEFFPLKPHEIDSFLDKVAYQDKAGSYTIQGFGSLLVKGIKGCYYNVTGLPVACLKELLQEFGIDLWTYQNA